MALSSNVGRPEAAMKLLLFSVLQGWCTDPLLIGSDDDKDKWQGDIQRVVTKQYEAIDVQI